MSAPHRHFGKRTSWLSNGDGIAGRNSKAAPPPPNTETPTQTLEMAGSLTRCPTKQQLSGYTLSSPSPTAVY